ncbi:Nucleoside diphosphate kinase 6 [Chionoecetes opilio]|uniref:Nucleoside diphosphate kinase 6 n=1 Tax=Chionoecetes opilio TaxID=41210 RepID=A0A8J5CKL6_CHIOP|nr:Nucleoside diphosphate kinase 6 [Chionoecetes opilio]
MAGRLQLTLALLKPDVTRAPHVLQAIRSKIIQEKFFVVRHKEIRLQRDKTEEFYKEHKGKFFYNRLVTFMASGPIQALVLAREDAIRHWRTVMGPTKVYKAKYEAPNTLRGLYGLTDTRNSTHGSALYPAAELSLQTGAPDLCQHSTTLLPKQLIAAFLTGHISVATSAAHLLPDTETI